MKALLLTEYKQMSYTTVADPVCGPSDVLIQVKACGICGSDIHGYDGSTGRRIPPLVMGHEAVARTIRSVFSLAEEANDQPTADLLTQRLQIHEKTAWMLRSLLEA